jgi:hypothetical protein
MGSEGAFSVISVPNHPYLPLVDFIWTLLNDLSPVKNNTKSPIVHKTLIPRVITIWICVVATTRNHLALLEDFVLPDL